MTKRIGPWLVGLLLAVIVCLVMTGSASGSPGPAGSVGPGVGRIEAMYSQSGPWAVGRRSGVDCCDSAGDKFDIWYPKNLGAGGFRHPIITWGDGTWAHPRQYNYLLSHLASWGFVVIAADNTEVGSGREILDAANYLVRKDADRTSVFYRKLNTHEIGAMGHSQGASGVLKAMAQSGGLIKTAVTVELPAQRLCAALPAMCVDTRILRSGAVFFVSGSADNIIAPATQALPWQSSGLQSQQAYYQATPPSVRKAWATLIGPNHNDVQGQPDCAAASVPCVEGVYGYLGYPTAWFLDQLGGDPRAHSVFVARTGELFHETTNWSNQASTITR